MLKRFLPKQKKFFDLFNVTAGLLVRAASTLLHMLQTPSACETDIHAIAALESQGDHAIQETLQLLHKTFIAPFDRHDIHALITGLDDILDQINRTAQHFPAWPLRQIPTHMTEMAGHMVEATHQLEQAILRLSSLEHASEIFHYCDQINHVENLAHEIGLAGEKKLFREENDFRQLIRLKEIYSQLKNMINSCQAVANRIRGIVLEYG